MEDGWIKFVTFSHVIAECLKEMRRELDQLLEEKIANPDLDLTTNVKGKLIIDTIVKLVQKEWIYFSFAMNWNHLFICNQ